MVAGPLLTPEERADPVKSVILEVVTRREEVAGLLAQVRVGHLDQVLLHLASDSAVRLTEKVAGLS